MKKIIKIKKEDLDFDLDKIINILDANIFENRIEINVEIKDG